MAPSSSPHDDVPKFGRTRHGSRQIARSTSVAPRGAPAGTGQCSARKAARGLRACMRKIREPLLKQCSAGGSVVGTCCASELWAQICPEPKRLYDFNLHKAAIGSAMSWSPDCDPFAALCSRRSRHEHVGATSNPLMRRSTVALRLRRPRIAKAAVARQRPANFWARAR